MTHEKRWFNRLWSAQALGDIARLFTPIMLVGGLSALTGMAYLGLMHLLQDGLGLERWQGWPRVRMMAGIGLIVGWLIRWLGSPGDVELLVDNIHVLGGRKQYKELRSLIPVSLLCIGAGGAMGPEAPLVQTTGALGTWISERRKLTLEDRRVLTIVGMAAGFTVLFGAPLGAAIFALEILHRRGMEYYEALMPAVIGSLWGYAVFTLATGWGLRPVWQFPAVGTLHPADIGWAVLAGIVGSAVAVGFAMSTWLLRKIMGVILPVWGPMVTGALLGLLSMWSIYLIHPQFGAACSVARTTAATAWAAVTAKRCSIIRPMVKTLQSL
ncbi:MAG: chloride channel protein, partial [Phycisphaerales bacterium]